MSVQTNIALVDDHVLLRNGLATYIKTFGNYTVLFEANNGKHFIEKITSEPVPEIVLMDINMPEMDGYETALWLKNNYPAVKVLALSMYDNENAILKMFKSGAKGYILKDCDPTELKTALNAVATKGYYYSEMVTGKIVQTINALDNCDSGFASTVTLSQRELTFLKYTCTEFTYKEIADKMFISPRTIDNYRDDLFQKLQIKTRVGLAMYAVRNGIVSF